MNPNAFMLPGSQLIDLIKMELAFWLGPAVDYCNHLVIVDCILGGMIHGQVINASPPPSQILEQYGIPYEAAESIASKIESELESYLVRVMGEELFDYNYIWDIYPNGDILMTVTQPNPVKFDPSSQGWMEIIRNGVARGDWYPEHMRRLAGC